MSLAAILIRHQIRLLLVLSINPILTARVKKRASHLKSRVSLGLCSICRLYRNCITQGAIDAADISAWL